MKKIFAIITFCLSLTMVAVPASAEELLEYEPDFSMMTLDLLVARPASLVATVIGTAVYVVSLPFSIAGGNEEKAAEVLVRAPAYNTFSRCLGCKSSATLNSIESQERNGGFEAR